MQEPLNPDDDPKAGGMGGDGASAADLLIDTHKAVRELLLAMEGMPSVGGSAGEAFDAFRGKAQIARRRLEDIDAELKSQKKNSRAVMQLTSTSGGSVPEIHVHLHLTIAAPTTNGQ